MSRERETLDHFLELSLLLLVVIRNQLHSLEHPVAIHGHFFVLGKVRLEHVQERLEDDCLDVVAGKLLINSVEDAVELRVDVMNQVVLLLDLLARDSIVPFFVITLGHHLELCNFPDGDFEFTQNDSHDILLYPDIDFWEFSKVIIV